MDGRVQRREDVPSSSGRDVIVTAKKLPPVEVRLLRSSMGGVAKAKKTSAGNRRAHARKMVMARWSSRTPEQIAETMAKVRAARKAKQKERST